MNVCKVASRIRLQPFLVIFQFSLRKRFTFRPCYFTILTPFTTYTPRFSELSDVAFFITSLPSMV